MKRALYRLAVVAVVAAAFGGAVASPASAGVVGVWPSAEACHAAGQRGVGTLWNHYSCYQVTGGWALWAPGY